jgi:hypothetical protein
MRNLEYNLKSFRLSDITIGRLKNIKDKSGESWNILFKQLLDLENKYGFLADDEQFKKKSRKP